MNLISKIVFFALLCIFVFACAPVKMQFIADRPINKELYSSVGDLMLKIEARENLPNIYGKADIWGRKRNRGFSEIRYLGLNKDGLPIFRRRDVDIITNEDTLNRSGFGTTSVSAQPSGQGIIATVVGTKAPDANVQVLSPDTIQFALDLNVGSVITIRNRIIEIMRADENGVLFIVK